MYLFSLSLFFFRLSFIILSLARLKRETIARRRVIDRPPVDSTLTSNSKGSGEQLKLLRALAGRIDPPH